MQNSIKRSFVNGAAFAAGASVFAGLAVVLAQSLHVFSSGDVVSASKVNANFQMAAPSGTISAFYLSTCPSGWIPADGTNGTPDLRGAFVRGLNTFDAGATTSTRDPEGARTLGSYQVDSFQGHIHAGSGYGSGGFVAAGGGGKEVSDIATPPDVTGAPQTQSGYGSPRTAVETRPKNVGLIYCMRKES